MAGPYLASIVVNAPAGAYAGAFMSDIYLNGGSATWETRTFNASGVQTVYGAGNLYAGCHDWTANTSDLITIGPGVYGAQHTSSLGNNNSDNVGPYGGSTTALSGGAYVSLRMFSSATASPFTKLQVRRSGAWLNPEVQQQPLWIRRSGAWLRRDYQNTLGQSAFVRRSGSWTTAFYKADVDLLRECARLDFYPDGDSMGWSYLTPDGRWAR